MRIAQEHERQYYKAAYSQNGEQLGAPHDSFGNCECIGGGRRTATHGIDSAVCSLVDCVYALEQSAENVVTGLRSWMYAGLWGRLR